MRVFPVLELPLPTDPYTVASRLAVVVTPPSRQLQSGEMTGWLAFVLHPACSSAAHTADQVGKLLLIWEKNKKA